VGDRAPAAAALSPRGPAALPRPRVTDLLAPARQRRATLVVAGAGYGKTTALTEIAATGPSRWVRLKPADRQVESLAARIAAALGEAPSAEPSGIAAATGSDDRHVLAERRAALLCELAEALQDDLLLVIDGVEHVGTDEAASHLLRVLSLEAPAQLHLVLSGRSLPDLGLGVAQGRGELLEVTAPDLSFTTAETAQLVDVRLGPDSLPLAAECWTLTGGWPAAEQLLLDRLERIAPADRGPALERLKRRAGQPWRAFARDLVGDEQPAARRVLAVAALVPRVDARLLGGAGVGATTGDLESLQDRGLLVEAGEPGYFRLSPVLTEAARPPDAAAADAAAAGDSAAGDSAARDSAAKDSAAGELRERAASWLAAHGRLDEALECHADGAPAAARSFLRRSGPALIRGGAAARVIEVLRRHGPGGDPELDAVLAEALQATGDWDAAIELFGRVERALGAQSRPASVAWRYGLLLYLRGHSGEAAATLSAAHDPDALGADDAMVSAWLSTTLWSQGQVDGAAELAGIALHQAGASRDTCALAAAHVALALAAASRGERERNEHEYRLALAAARDGGDRVQLARIHANLSSRALENGEYPLAISEAELALETGVGHRFFSALALTNKAEAHMRLGQLDESRAAIADAEAICATLGTLLAAIPQVLYGELYRLRGDLVRARGAYERARALAAEADDVHTLVAAQAGLARVLAEEDISAARAVAADAVAQASSLERAIALCAAAEVELRARDGAAAGRLARQAESEARTTGDRAALAEALELQGAAAADGGQSRFRSAIDLWEDVGNPVGTARARLGLALRTEDRAAADAIRRELAGLGIAADGAVPGLLAAAGPAGREVAIVALGRFAVLHAGKPVPLAAWQSRKARDLLKVLVARKGRPITRDAAAEAMWPHEDPEPLGNRLSVALSTIRKVLDPERRHPADHYVVADARTIALRVDHADVDLIEFNRVAELAIELMAKGDNEAAAAPLQRARQIYAGDFLEEDLYEEWAVEAREEARSRLFTILRLLARLAADRGDDESAAQHLSQLLEREPYDEDAWLSLIAGQLRLRRHGQARRYYAAYARRMSELDVAPVPLADAADWRP
jgi:ATP/maltotriose-dependent transcriptional regulator MalT/DNA-binding SARP family transcriptional activator